LIRERFLFSTQESAMVAHRLSRLQLAIMHVLWERGRASVADIREALEPDRSLAYSTVATLLGRMERKGVVRHRAEGRTYVYEAAVAQDRIQNSLVTDLVERVFDGSPAQLVSHLLETQDVDSQELKRIQSLVEQYAAEAARIKPKRRRRS
jgi:BlaI family transcriptional regulator, penicillinase repressor